MLGKGHDNLYDIACFPVSFGKDCIGTGVILFTRGDTVDLYLKAVGCPIGNTQLQGELA